MARQDVYVVEAEETIVDWGVRPDPEIGPNVFVLKGTRGVLETIVWDDDKQEAIALVTWPFAIEPVGKGCTDMRLSVNRNVRDGVPVSKIRFCEVKRVWT